MSADRKIVDPSAEDLLAILGLDYSVRSAGPTSGGYFAVLEGDGRIVYLTESGSSIIAAWRDAETCECGAVATREVGGRTYCDRDADRAASYALLEADSYVVSTPIGAAS